MFEDQIPPQSTGWKAMAALGATAMLALGGLGVYAEHEHKAAVDLEAQNQQISSALSTTRGQVDELTSKVNTLLARSTPQAAPAPVLPSAKATSHKKHVEDAKMKKLQSQVDAQGKAIDDTRSQIAGTRDDLNNSRTELTGSIARSHDEIVMLQKKGERNYYEFDVQKSKQFNFQGPVGVRLKKANAKHDYADLELMLDDRSLSQKHVNIYQPVMFYTPDIPQPIELVINSISKDHIHGYISSPKYRQSELAAMQSTAASGTNGATAPTDTPSSARQKLPTPR
jgi:hypothetical protein